MNAASRDAYIVRYAKKVSSWTLDTPERLAFASKVLRLCSKRVTSLDSASVVMSCMMKVGAFYPKPPRMEVLKCQ